ADLVDVLAGHDTGSCRNPKLSGNGAGGAGMIAGDHFHSDAGVVAFLDGADRLGPRWVDEAEDAEQNEPVLGIRVIDIAHVRRGLFQGNGQQPLTLSSQAVQAFMPTNNVYRLLPAVRPLGLAPVPTA